MGQLGGIAPSGRQQSALGRIGGRPMSVACSILIPAHNEAGYIQPCLEALLASDQTGSAVEVIVMANGCTDDTVDAAR